MMNQPMGFVLFIKSPVRIVSQPNNSTVVNITNRWPGGEIKAQPSPIRFTYKQKPTEKKTRHNEHRKNRVAIKFKTYDES